MILFPCRAQLYGDVTASLHEVRQMVAENVGKMRERLGIKTPSSSIDSLRDDSLRDIQEENAQLNKMVYVHTIGECWL